MPKPITYESPKLTRRKHDLMLDLCLADSWHRFVCIDHLTRLLNLDALPEASEYRIKVSTEQWGEEGGGCELWVRKRNGDWFWGSTQEYQEKAFFYTAMDALDTSDLPTDRPVKIYFRLTYYE